MSRDLCLFGSLHSSLIIRVVANTTCIFDGSVKVSSILVGNEI